MFCRRAYVCIAILTATSSASAEDSANLTDAQILNVIRTADRIDIAAANLALRKSSNNDVREFATGILSDYTGASKALQSSETLSNIRPQDNDVSKSLASMEAEQTQELAKLSGLAFDKAYTQNEAAYLAFVTGALELTLIPSTQNEWLKTLLQNKLALFKRHYNNVTQIGSQFK